MILTVAVLAVLLLAFAVPSLVAAHEDRQRRRRHPPDPAEPQWWSEFERDFRTYALELERRRAVDPGEGNRRHAPRPRPE